MHTKHTDDCQEALFVNLSQALLHSSISTVGGGLKGVAVLTTAPGCGGGRLCVGVSPMRPGFWTAEGEC